MTVVVGYVPTKTGLLAITKAAEQAHTGDSEVLVVNVVGERGYTVRTAAEERDLDAVVKRLSDDGIRSTLHQVDSDATPAEVILAEAAKAGASLIVLGLHQRSWLAKRALGSTVRSVVLAAPCPVLVVPDVDVPTRGHLGGGPPPLHSMGQE